MFELLAVIVPMLALPPGIPFTSQEIVVPPGMHEDAEKFCVWPSETPAATGEIEFTDVQVTMTLAEPDFEVSASLVAITLTVAGEGGVTGAV